MLTFGGLFSGAPGVEVLKIDYKEDRGVCDHHVTGEGEPDEPNRRVKKSDRDVLIWRITNECTDAQEVTIERIVNPDQPVDYPFLCGGDPEKANIGASFELEAPSGGVKKVRAFIVCAVKWPSATYKERFKLHDKLHMADQHPRAHEISIEVVP
jgi:hypothetical protein